MTVLRFFSVLVAVVLVLTLVVFFSSRYQTRYPPHFPALVEINIAKMNDLVDASVGDRQAPLSVLHASEAVALGNSLVSMASISDLQTLSHGTFQLTWNKAKKQVFESKIRLLQESQTS